MNTTQSSEDETGMWLRGKTFENYPESMHDPQKENFWKAGWKKVMKLYVSGSLAIDI